MLTLISFDRYGQAVGTDLCPLIPTTPQENMGNRSLTIATGRLLGGGSAINGLVWVSHESSYLSMDINLPAIDPWWLEGLRCLGGAR